MSMSAKLDKDGDLSIERKGKFKEQFCQNLEKAIRCGDCCPRLTEYESTDLDGKKVGTHIYTCGSVSMDLTVDER